MEIHSFYNIIIPDPKNSTFLSELYAIYDVLNIDSLNNNASLYDDYDAFEILLFPTTYAPLFNIISSINFFEYSISTQINNFSIFSNTINFDEYVPTTQIGTFNVISTSQLVKYIFTAKQKIFIFVSQTTIYK